MYNIHVHVQLIAEMTHTGVTQGLHRGHTHTPSRASNTMACIPTQREIRSIVHVYTVHIDACTVEYRRSAPPRRTVRRAVDGGGGAEFRYRNPSTAIAPRPRPHKPRVSKLTCNTRNTVLRTFPWPAFFTTGVSFAATMSTSAFPR